MKQHSTVPPPSLEREPSLQLVLEVAPHGVAKAPDDDPCEACGHVKSFPYLPVHGDWSGLTNPDAQCDWDYLTPEQVVQRLAEAWVSNPECDTEPCFCGECNGTGKRDTESQLRSLFIREGEDAA